MRLFTCGVLMLSVIGAVCRGRPDRPRFAGFAAFGWGYFALAHWYTYHQGSVPTVRFVPGSVDIHGDLRSVPPLVRGVHDAWALAFALSGWHWRAFSPGMHRPARSRRQRQNGQAGGERRFSWDFWARASW